MLKRRDLSAEKKRPNLSIPVGKTIFINYPIYCSNKISSVSREIAIFINKIITENKIEEEYLEEPRKDRFAVSIEESIAKKYKILCDKYKAHGQLNYYTSPIIKFIEGQLKEKTK